MRDVLSAARASEWQRVSKLDFLTADEAAIYIRVSRTTFDGLVKGGLRFSRPAGPGLRRFMRSHLDELMWDHVTSEATA